MNLRNQILIGDCLERMRDIPSGIVQCVVTSPPYFALRSYLPAGHALKSKEIGSEPTPDAFIATMVAVFAEVRRVLRDDGTCFINLGDSYASTGGQHEAGSSDGAVGRGPRGKRQKESSGQLLNIPHRVAEALRQDGWNWRQTIVWAKKSPMPESVNGWRWMRCRVKASSNTNHDGGKNADHIDRRKVGFNDRYDAPDEHSAKWSPCPGCHKCEPNGGWILRQGKGRCTTAHEYIFVMTKGDRYFWDSESSREAQSQNTLDRFGKNNIMRTADAKAAFADQGNTLANADYKRHLTAGDIGGRNPRSYWLLSSEPSKERHFATFPSELVRRCLVAGCSAGGCCAHCGTPWAPMVESDRVATRPGVDTKCYETGGYSPESPYRDHAEIGNRDPQRHVAITRTLGYRQTCNCPAHSPARQIVFDPFSGIGTTAQTARQLGHDYLGCELNPEYAAIGNVRIQQPPRWLLRQQKPAKKPKPVVICDGQGHLFDLAVEGTSK